MFHFHYDNIRDELKFNDFREDLIYNYYTDWVNEFFVSLEFDILTKMMILEVLNKKSYHMLFGNNSIKANVNENLMDKLLEMYPKLHYSIWQNEIKLLGEEAVKMENRINASRLEYKDAIQSNRTIIEDTLDLIYRISKHKFTVKFDDRGIGKFLEDEDVGKFIESYSSKMKENLFHIARKSNKYSHILYSLTP